MPRTILGIYRDGKVELAGDPQDVRDETRVIVTFLESGAVDLKSRGIDEGQARELLGRMAAFEKDWNSPEMSIYDDYDAAKSNL